MSAVNYFLKMNLHECKPQNNHNDPNFPGGSAPRPGTSRPTVTQLAARSRNEGKGHNPPPPPPPGKDAFSGNVRDAEGEETADSHTEPGWHCAACLAAAKRPGTACPPVATYWSV